MIKACDSLESKWKQFVADSGEAAKDRELNETERTFMNFRSSGTEVQWKSDFKPRNRSCHSPCVCCAGSTGSPCCQRNCQGGSFGSCPRDRAR